MTAALSLVFLLSGLSAAKGVGVPVAGCKCVKNDLTVLTSFNDMLLATPGALDGNMAQVPYPITYGESCGKHLEPGSTDCSFANGTELPDVNRSKWCNLPWCHVDPCTCQLPDIQPDSYFPGSGLFVSYLNCGGVPPGYPSTPAAAACPGGVFTPTGKCTKMDNEAPKVPCNNSWAVDGLCVMANNSGRMIPYPANYGEGCGIHLEPGDSDCSFSDGTPKPLEDQANWCKLPWTYVNPCDCNASDISVDRYWLPKTLFYSYSVCGSVDPWNYGNGLFNFSDKTLQVAKQLSARASCPSPAPLPAVVQSPFNYPRSQAAHPTCQCKSFTDIVPSALVHCSTNYSQKGNCINITNSRGLTGLFPANYGSTCGLHAEPLDAGCFNLDTGMPWPAPCRGNLTFGCRQARCDQPWCFVDPCCKGVKLDGTFRVNGTKLYVGYSYQNCGGNDTTRNSSVNVNMTGINCKISAAFSAQGLMSTLAVVMALLRFA